MAPSFDLARRLSGARGGGFGETDDRMTFFLWECDSSDNLSDAAAGRTGRSQVVSRPVDQSTNAATYFAASSLTTT